MKQVFTPIPRESNVQIDFTEIMDKLDIIETKVTNIETGVVELSQSVLDLQTSSAECCTTTQFKLNRIIKLLKSSETIEEWEVNMYYSIDDLVVYNGIEYICIQSNTSYDATLTPDITPALWNVYNQVSTDIVEVVSNKLPSVPEIDTYEVKKTILGKETLKKVKK